MHRYMHIHRCKNHYTILLEVDLHAAGLPHVAVSLIGADEAQRWTSGELWRSNRKNRTSRCMAAPSRLLVLLNLVHAPRRQVQIALRTPHEKPGFLDKNRRSDQTLRRVMRLEALSWDRRLTEPSHHRIWWWWWKIPIWFSLSVANDEVIDNPTSWLAKWAPSRSERRTVRSTGRILHYRTS